jgi:hypothetical protein
MAKQPIWDVALAHQLFMAGLSPTAIARKINSRQSLIWKYAQRHKWVQARDSILNSPSSSIHLNGLTGCSDSPTHSLPALSEDIKLRLAREVDAQSRMLTQTPCTSIAELCDSKQGRAGLLKTVLENANRVFNWDKETPQTILQVGTVSNMNILLQGPQEASAGPASTLPVVVDADCKVISDTPVSTSDSPPTS